MANKDIDLIFEAYMEAKEAPKGKHYDSAGRLRKGDADADGRGGPKYRSDPTYVNPNDEEMPEEDWEKGTSKAPKGKSFDMSRGGAPSNVDAARDGSGGRYRKTRPPSAPSNKTHSEMEELPEEDDLSLGHNTPAMIKITSIGNTTPFKKKTEAPIEDQEAAVVHIQAGETPDHAGKHQFSYDGEIDMARAELLKASDYSNQLFDMVANTEALPGWVASKITKASDYLSSVFHYMDYEMKYKNEGDCDEESEGDDFKQAEDDINAAKEDLDYKD